MSYPSHIDQSLEALEAQSHLRSLRLPREGLVDFTSNDYLGLARSSAVQDAPKGSWGSAGSRLLAGNSASHEQLEQECARIFAGEAALLFGSGYMANLALMGALPQRGDTLLLDEQCHASLREGARLSLAHHHTFSHNDLQDLERKIRQARGTVYVVTEGLFSMDGDQPPLAEMSALCKRMGAWLVLDEAHSTGILGNQGEGLACQLGLQDSILARVHTFGKAVGRMGAVVVADQPVIQYLLNKARPFIYSTALPDVMVESVREALQKMRGMTAERETLLRLRAQLNEILGSAGSWQIPATEGPIVPIVVPGNEAVRRAADQLLSAGLDVRPILSPTVPMGTERLRVILHSFNTPEEVSRLADALHQIS